MQLNIYFQQYVILVQNTSIPSKITSLEQQWTQEIELYTLLTLSNSDILPNEIMHVAGHRAQTL